MVTRRRLPLTALRSFEAAARLGSLTRAAAELHVTHAAISHQVRRLEEHVGLELFHRIGRRVELSEAGHVLLPVLNEAFARIASAIEDLGPATTDADVTLVAPADLLVRWLLPRVGRLRAAHPDLDVRLLPADETPVPTRRPGSRLVIRAGRGNWRDGVAEEFMPIGLALCCSPGYARERQLRVPADLARAVLWESAIEEGSSDWPAWLVAAGAAELVAQPRLVLRDPHLALQVALDGQGAVLVDRRLAEESIAEGRLVTPFATVLRHPCAWWFVRSRRSLDRGARLVRDWLLGEAGTPEAERRPEPDAA